jgi:hypothetical protein
MRRTANLALVLALAGAVVAAVSPAKASQTPRLRIVALSPLTIGGTGFHPRERTRVTANTGAGSQTVRVVANRLGTFRVTLDQVTPTRCDLIRIVAIRRSGTIVAFKHLPAPACLPESAPQTTPDRASA